MNIKIKAAVITVIFNILLTIVKFIAYAFSGSLAILSESWHSFSDIITSVAVLYSVAFDNTTKQKQVSTTINKDNFVNRLKNISAESKAAFLIGIFLLIVSIFIFEKVFYSEIVIIKNSLITGILFLLFSIGSFIVSNFETSIGKRHNSISLISDGMHAKSDLFASALTGFSLILYYLNINIDTYIAFIIALFILSFAIETIVNVIIYEIKDHNKQDLFQYKTFTLITNLFNPANWSGFIKFIDKKFNFNFSDCKIIKFLSKKGYTLLFIIIVLIYAFTSIYNVNFNEECIIERFGKPLNYGKPIKPGLHFKLPWPIDKAIKIKVDKIHKIDIGNIPDKNNLALLWTIEHSTGEPFLSGDNNLLYPYLTIHYTVNNIFDYYYTNKDIELIITDYTSKIISEIIVQKSFYDLGSVYRKKFEDTVKNNLQKILNDYNSGISILTVNLKDLHPPVLIAESFENVISAMQEKQELINLSLSYKNEIIPRIESDNIRQIKSSEAYVKDKIYRAEGEVYRFEKMITNFQNKSVKSIIKKKLYFDYIKQSMKFNNKIIIDPKTGKPDVWLKNNKIILD
jgi:membrane protease subunit HflK